MYRFKVIQDGDGWRYKAYGPINYTSRVFDTQHECYTHACELGYVPIPKEEQ